MDGKNFPKDFLWGASTSSFQTEGGITHSDWAEAERKGEVPPIGKACDYYNRYQEDFDTAKALGHNTHRFSIEWSRIEPEEGKFDVNELQHYKQMVLALKERGIEPFVCLWHFSLPLWFSQSGSFGRRDAPDIFARYVSKVVQEIGDDVNFYITINEPMVWLGEQGVTTHSSPGFLPNIFSSLHYFNQLVRAHKKAYRIIKEKIPHSHVGVAKHNFSFVGTNIFGSLYAYFARYFWNRIFLDAIKNYQDFIGLQYYQRWYFWQNKNEEREAIKSDIGWQIIPEGIYDTIKEAVRYKKPIYITESGIADGKDKYRESFIRKSLESIHRAIEEGMPVKGYLHWSLLDNYEFVLGYTMKFGLLEVDHANDQKRTVRESAKVYAKIIKNNSV